MAALLRFSLDANQAGLVPLSAELKVVADYLEIERARFGDRLRYQIDVPSDLETARVPPLAVQTLVENSVKYAVTPNRGGGEIRIAGTRENGSVSVTVTDQGPAFTLESVPRGHGLDNLKDRLATLFGHQAGLTLHRSENRNSVVLTVPYASILVDDEALALKRLSRMLAATGRVEIVGVHTDPLEALAIISK